MDTEPPIAEKQDFHNMKRNRMRFVKRDSAGERGKMGSNRSNDKGSLAEERYSSDRSPNDFMPSKPFDRMASDRFGEELAPDAAIWGIYLDEAQEQDRELVERQRGLDTHLIFAALFSAILAIFLVESKDLLRQDPAEASVALLLVLAESQRRIELGLPAPSEPNGPITISEFSPSLSARWVNAIWFTALGTSLSAAVIAMLGKEWLIAFHSSRSRSASERHLACVRQSRFKGFEDWGALDIIALPPMLLHASLLLFSVGLVTYLWVLDAAIAAVLAGITGVALAFYFTTGILGVVYEFCPFVTEFSRYTRRALAALTTLPSRDSDMVPATIPTKDLQSLIWLAKRAVDPIVIDRAYQAMAGLHKSPYIIPNRLHPKPKFNRGLTKNIEVSLFGHGVTVTSLFLEVTRRFDSILAGTLETDSLEPPVCRYVNAMIALGFYTEELADIPLKHWLNICDRIDRLWSSNIPEESLSGSSFAGVLIAEMDVLKIAIGLIQETLSTDRWIEDPTAVDSKYSSSALQHTIEATEIDSKFHPVIQSSLLRLKKSLTEWLDLSLSLLLSHAEGAICVDIYLLNGLSRAIQDGASQLKLVYSMLRAQNQTSLAADSGSREHAVACLKVIIDILSQTMDSGPELITHLNEILKTFSTFTSMLPCSQPQDKNHLDQAFNIRDLAIDPASSRFEISWISIRYAIKLASYTINARPDFPQRVSIFKSALGLWSDLLLRNQSQHGLFEVVSYHIGDYVRIVESVDTDIEEVNRTTLNELCCLAALRWSANQPPLGHHISPLGFRNLILAFSGTATNLRSIQAVMDLIVCRLRIPDTFSVQIPPQITPIPEPRPTIDYLHQFTRFSGGFSALAKARSININYCKPVSCGIADIAIIAANMDPAVTVQPIELQAPAVPGFLQAVSSSLRHLSYRECGGELRDRFILAASILLVTAREDPESEEIIRSHPSPAHLLMHLRIAEGYYLDLMTKAKWNWLVNGLDFGGINTEQVDNDDDSGVTSDDGSGLGTVSEESEQESNEES